MTSRSDFRRDINGLRAWAVVVVVLYHFGVPGFSGGFIGVDVFFVISGFLMTGIVISGLERDSGFHFWAFYLARARRIVPALIVLCAILLALGWWVLVPLEYKLLGTHTASSLIFISNIMFWSEAGYFDAASHEKWLLHTWSLAVEWQFYLLLPLALKGVWKLRPGRATVTRVIAAALIASLALSIMMTPIKPIAAFYLLPTRAWEMLGGGLIFLLARKRMMTGRQSAALEAVGLSVIVGAVLLFDAGSNWPGWRALLPVVGTLLVLLSAQADSRWTGLSLAQWLGTRSYSLYLWHWPVVVALLYLEWQTNVIAVFCGLLLTVVLGHFSYRWIEAPSLQFFGQLSSRWSGALLLCAVVVVVSSGVEIRSKNGVAGRLSAQVDSIAKEAANTKPRRDFCFTKSGTASPSCMYGGNQLQAILIGDSYADAVTTALAAAVKHRADGIMDWSYVSCPTIRGVKNLSPKFMPNERCGEFLEWAVKQLNSVPKNIPLVIVNRNAVYALGHNEPWENDANTPLVYFTKSFLTSSPAFLAEYAQRLTDTACQLAQDRPVFLVRPIPEMGVDVPKAMVRAMAWGRQKDVSISLAEYHRRQDFVWAAQNAARDRCGVRILDPVPYLCPDGRCHGVKDGRPLYSDDDHLSEFGNKLLVPMFTEVFQSK